jgi:gliding motility-associated-like protein
LLYRFNPVYKPKFANGAVQLIIVDTSTCNVRDTAEHSFIVYAQPVADFILTNDTFKFEKPVTFQNNSINYDHLLWNFGDGDTAVDETNPVHTYESIYNKLVCITAYNSTCVDTTCKNIFIIFTPLIGVPNAFSPNGDGINDIVRVEGRGIVELTFRIFNRWGELVFESHDVHDGWDGFYKGQLQEMDVFTYTVDAVLINGQRVPLKGNITLLK